MVLGGSALVMSFDMPAIGGVNQSAHRHRFFRHQPLLRFDTLQCLRIFYPDLDTLLGTI
jgi:hypothetical protein